MSQDAKPKQRVVGLARYTDQQLRTELDRRARAAGKPAAQWVGKTRPGDGLLLQVTEQWSGTGPDATWSRQIVFDLLTRDNNGNPFWLVGSTPFAEGDISVNADVYYLAANNTPTPWGKAVFSFPNCNELDMKLTPNAGLPAPAPSFGGTQQFSRLFSANGMICE